MNRLQGPRLTHSSGVPLLSPHPCQSDDPDIVHAIQVISEESLNTSPASEQREKQTLVTCGDITFVPCLFSLNLIFIGIFFKLWLYDYEV